MTIFSRSFRAKSRNPAATRKGNSTGSFDFAQDGEAVDAREAKTISELIDRYELPPQSILVEHNGLALHRHEWPKRLLAEGDCIEFIRVVAGG